MKNEHKVVQDLFPSYIDGLLALETKEFVEAHISSCEECKKVLEDMKSKIQEENRTSLDNEKIKYAKKVKRKLNFLGLLVWIILIIIIAFTLNFDRKAMILRSLQSKRK